MHMSWVLCRLLLQRRALVITVHDQQDARRWGTLRADLRLGARFLARLPAVRWIAVSPTVREQLVARGVRGQQIEVIPAFISPGSEASNSEVLPASLLAFLANHRPVLSIYGSKYDFVEGVDLYGFDLAVEAVALLKASHPHAGLVVCMPGKHQLDYQSLLVRRADQLSCLDSICFLNEGVLDGSELWRRSHVHLRPTVTDGDSVAVREALALGVPVVASDATPRPPDCVQFPSRNLEAFVTAIGSALTRPTASPAVAGMDPASPLPRILREYGKALGRSLDF
jgi:glycosyltransferase involved in cell wall biosynthesis